MAVAFVQGKTNFSASTTSSTVTLGSAPTSGNLLVAYLEHSASGRPTTGSPSGTGWSVAATSSGAGGTARASGYWWKIAGAGESATITYSGITLTAPWSMTVVEYSGIDTTSTVNAAPVATTGSVTTTLSITTTAVAGLVVAFSANRSTTSTTAWSAHAFAGSTTGVTARVNNNLNNQAGTSGLATAWDFIGTLPAAANTATVTAPTADVGTSGIAAFNAAATGGGAPNFVPGTGVRRRTIKRALPVRANPGSFGPPDSGAPALPPAFRRRIRRYPRVYVDGDAYSPGPSSPPVSTLIDDFAFQDNAKWFWNPGFVDWLPSGQVQITVLSTSYFNLPSVYLYDLRNSAVSIQIISLPNPTVSGEMHFSFYDDASQNSVRFVYTADNGTPHLNLRIETHTPPLGTSDVTLTWDWAAMQYWRLRHDGVNVNWDYSGDGVNWTTGRSAPAPYVNLGQGRVIPQAGIWQAEVSPGTAVFDNVNITAPRWIAALSPRRFRPSTGRRRLPAQIVTAQAAPTAPAIAPRMSRVRRFAIRKVRGIGTSAVIAPALPIPALGLALRLDASAITGLADGAGVPSWDDLSGSGRSVTQATTIARPTYATGAAPSGLPAVRFNGTSQFLSNLAAFPLTGGYTVFLAHKAGPPVAGMVAFQDGSANGIGFQIATASLSRELVLRGVVDNVDGLYPANTPEVWQGDGPGTNGVHSLRVNDGAATTVTATVLNATTGMTVGVFENNTSFFYAGDMYELVAYSRQLTTAEITQVYNYLNAKWLTTAAPAMLRRVLRAPAPGRRARAAQVTPAQAATPVVAYAPALPHVRRLAAILRRPRATLAAPSVDAPLLGRASARRPGRNRPRAALWRPVAAQDSAPVRLGRLRGRLAARRPGVTAPVPVQLAPQAPAYVAPGTSGRRRWQLAPRRPRVATVTRPQINPPWQPISVRGLRLVGRTVRRASTVKPVQAQQPAAPNPTITQTVFGRLRLAGRTNRRPGTPKPIPAQVNPPIVQTVSARLRTTGRTTRRGVAPVPTQVAPIIQTVFGRLRLAGRTTRRPGVAKPAPSQAAPVNPTITQTVFGRLRVAVRARPRTKVSNAIPAQPTVPANPRLRPAGRIRLRTKISNPTLTQQAAPVNPTTTQTVFGRLRLTGRTNRQPRIVKPIPPQVNPPYPVKPSRVVAFRGASRRRAAPTSSPQVQPTAETRTAVQGGLRGLRRVWVKIRRKTATPIPDQVATLQGPLVVTDSHGGVEADRGGNSAVGGTYASSASVSGAYGSTAGVTADPDSDGVAAAYDSDSDVL